MPSGQKDAVQNDFHSNEKKKNKLTSAAGQQNFNHFFNNQKKGTRIKKFIQKFILKVSLKYHAAK